MSYANAIIVDDCVESVEIFAKTQQSDFHLPSYELSLVVSRVSSHLSQLEF